MPTQCQCNAKASREVQKILNRGFYFKQGVITMVPSDGSLARGESRECTEDSSPLWWVGLDRRLSLVQPLSRQPALQSGFFIARDLTSRMRRRVSNPRPDGSLAFKQGNQANPALTVPIVNWSGKLPLADRSKRMKRLPVREGMLSTPIAYSVGLERLDTFPGKKGNL